MSVENLQVVLSLRQQPWQHGAVETYQIEIVQAPGSGWGGPLLPLGLDEGYTIAIRKLYRGYLERVQRNQLQLDERELEPLRVAGSQLFRALPETVQTRLHQVQAQAREQGRGLELVLTFEASARPLLALPWELLHDPASRVFLAMQGGGVTRRLWLPAAPALAPDFCPLKMIGVWSEPATGARLQDRASFQPSPEQPGPFTWVTGSDSLGQLAQALAANTFDGLHLVAHGRAGYGWRDFSLALTDERGDIQWTSPDQLATFLAGYPSIQFVYLDVCAAAGSGLAGEAEYQPGGLAINLMGIGIPVVIAMQDAVSQTAAGQMARTFYEQLAQQASLAEAMAAARRAARVALDDPLHWSVPVLYSQQRFEEPVAFPVRLADRVLNDIHEIVRPEIFVWFAALLLAGGLAKRLAVLHPGLLADWRAAAVLVAESVFLVLMGAGAMQAGQRQLGEDFQLGWRDWLEVLLHKYTGAAIWAYGWWSVLGAASLILSRFGVAGYFGEAVPRVGWGLALSGLSVAGYIGARQAIRQSRLFIPLGPSRRLGQDIFLFLAIPFIPVILAWLWAASWRFLTESWLGLWLVVGMCLILALMVRGMRAPYSEKK